MMLWKEGETREGTLSLPSLFLWLQRGSKGGEEDTYASPASIRSSISHHICLPALSSWQTLLWEPEVQWTTKTGLVPALMELMVWW